MTGPPAVDAAAAAASIGAELHRLVPAVHRASRPRNGPLLTPLRPHVGFVVDLRTLLSAGPAPLTAVRAIHRYQDGVDTALDELTAGGWLRVRDNADDAVVATDRCRALLDPLMAGLDATCTDLWGSPDAVLTLATSAIDAAASAGPGFEAFDALAAAGHPGDGSAAGRLFTALCTLRYHRADAHAAAWAAAGLTADGVAALPDGDPVRRRIEAATDRVAARPYRAMPDAAAFLAGLRSLPG